MIETLGSLCQAAGSPRGPRTPTQRPGPCSARGQFSSPFLLRRDSNQTTRSAEEGKPHANPLAAPGRGVSGSQRVPLNRPVPPRLRHRGRVPVGGSPGVPEASAGPMGAGPPAPTVGAKARTQSGSAFGPTRSRPAGSCERQRQADQGGGRRGCPQTSPAGRAVCFIRLVGAAPWERGPLGARPGPWRAAPWPPEKEDASEATGLHPNQQIRTGAKVKITSEK